MIELWEHQKEWAKRIKANEICALWAAMRTGKTLATIAGTDDGDRLIVCPNSVKGVWQSDLAAYGEEAYTLGAKPRPVSRPRNVIINYEMLWRTSLLGDNFDSIIFDESLRLQNMRTKLWKGITRHAKAIAQSRVVLLSGTPCPEGYHQLITQATVATGQYCGERDTWEALRKFYTYNDEKFKWEINAGHKPAARAQLAAMGPSMTQAEAGVLTKKLYRTIRVPLGPEEMRLWAKVDKGIMPATLAMHAQSVASGRPVKGATERSAKLRAVAEYVEELPGQAVILTRFTESLRHLKGLLPGAECVSGEDEGAQYRLAVFDRFARGRTRVLICNVMTVKVGVNLSAASALIFAENSFSGEARIQAEERATVKGKEAVEIVDFISTGEDMPGEIDDYILQAVRMKKDFNYKLLRSL